MQHMSRSTAQRLTANRQRAGAHRHDELGDAQRARQLRVLPRLPAALKPRLELALPAGSPPSRAFLRSSPTSHSARLLPASRSSAAGRRSIQPQGVPG
jgi:hypothetical protein